MIFRTLRAHLPAVIRRHFPRGGGQEVRPGEARHDEKRIWVLEGGNAPPLPQIPPMESFPKGRKALPKFS